MYTFTIFNLLLVIRYLFALHLNQILTFINMYFTSSYYLQRIRSESKIKKMM